MPRRPALRRALCGVVSILVAACAAETSAGELDLSGHVNIESRGYPGGAAYPGQFGHAGGIVLEPELYFQSDAGWSFTLVPFLRYDAADSERSHIDLREAWFLMYGDAGDGEWELRLGVDRVFWGVTESHHLVDIINQTDLVDHPNEEVELGQLMAHATWSGEWGAAELFVLPHQRKRTFAGYEGRLRSVLPVDQDNPSWESSAQQWNTDLAARYSWNAGVFDFGVSLFDGANREPVFQPNLRDGRAVLTPHYGQIRQWGLDVQATYEAWLLKLEAIYRTGAHNLLHHRENYAGLVAGGEYTLYSIFGSNLDLDLLGEWNYDQRGERATNVFQDDLFFGARLAFNDMQDTAVTAGILKDVNHSTSSLVLEFNRRISDQWSSSAEIFALFDVDEEDVQFYPVRRDSFIEWILTYNF